MWSIGCVIIELCLVSPGSFVSSYGTCRSRSEFIDCQILIFLRYWLGWSTVSDSWELGAFGNDGKGLGSTAKAYDSKSNVSENCVQLRIGHLCVCGWVVLCVCVCWGEGAVDCISLCPATIPMFHFGSDFLSSSLILLDLSTAGVQRNILSVQS